MSDDTGMDALRWQAVVLRNEATTGPFVYGVHSTGIYCRPTCSARPKRRESVAFFDTAGEARRHGFRACRKCRPDGATASGCG